MCDMLPDPLPLDAPGPGTVVAIVLAALVLPPGTARSQSNDQTPQIRGARIYGNLCGRCHNARSPAEFSDRDWTTIVMHMRTRTHMSRSEARAVEAFLRASNQNGREDRAAAKAIRPDRKSVQQVTSVHADSLGTVSVDRAARLVEFLQRPSQVDQ